jgi:hypothetical protein
VIILGFLAFVAVLTLSVKAGVYLMGRRAGAQIALRHREAEHIMESREPPDTWSDSHDRVNRLDGLIAYFRQSQLVADEPTREFLLNELQDVRQRWEAGRRPDKKDSKQ